MEPRALTRVDVHSFARRAYDLGVRYLGGCCGFEPYHIRAIAEEVRYKILLFYFVQSMTLTGLELCHYK